MLKKILATATLASALLLPTSKANAHDITLQYDYFENKQNTTIIENENGNQQFNDLILNAQNYNDFTADANSLLTKNKIHLTAYTGALASTIYDPSQTYKDVAPEKLFNNIQNQLETSNAPPLRGAKCGPIHHTMMKTAQHLGLEAVTYTGRSKNKGTGHIFTSIHDPQEGFAHLSYGEIMHTNTHNYYQALVLSQRAQGRIDLDHRVYDDEFLFRYLTPDAQHFFRYTSFDPEPSILIDHFLTPPNPPSNSVNITAGNTELSIEGTLFPKPFVLFAKAGRMNGQPPSALRNATILEGGFGAYHHDNNTFLDARIALIYALFNEHNNTKENKIFILSDTNIGTKWTVNKNIKLGAGTRLFTAADIPDSLKDNDQMLGIFDITGTGLIEIKQCVTLYTSIQGMLGHNNIREQKLTMHLGDIETGIALQNPIYLKLAGKLKPEAYVIETTAGKKFHDGKEHLTITGRHGWGRHCVFTPDYIEAETAINIHPLENLTLKAQATYRHEKWSHNENNNQASGQVTMEIKF